MSTHRPPAPRKLAAAAVWIAAVACLGAGTGFAEETRLGILRGRFVVRGELPNEPPAWAESPHGDTAARWTALRDDRSLVIDRRSRGLANALVYLRRPPIAVAEKSPGADAMVRLKHGRFWPHMTRVQTGQAIRVVIEDAGPYNLDPAPFVNPSWSTVPSPGDFRIHTFRYDRPEFFPTAVRCGIHPWFVGYWLILDHPYSAVSDEQGRFEIKDLPEGEYDFIVWHERVGYLDKRVDAVDRAFKLQLKPGRNDLGDIEIPAEVFEPRH